MLREKCFRHWNCNEKTRGLIQEIFHDDIQWKKQNFLNKPSLWMRILFERRRKGTPDGIEQSKSQKTFPFSFVSHVHAYICKDRIRRIFPGHFTKFPFVTFKLFFHPTGNAWTVSIRRVSEKNVPWKWFRSLESVRLKNFEKRREYWHSTANKVQIRDIHSCKTRRRRSRKSVEDGS